MFFKQNLSTDLASRFIISSRGTYNFPTSGRKSHKSPPALVPLWPFLIIEADLSSLGKAPSDQDYLDLLFFSLQCLLSKSFFSFQAVEIS